MLFGKDTHKKTSIYYSSEASLLRILLVAMVTILTSIHINTLKIFSVSELYCYSSIAEE